MNPRERDPAATGSEPAGSPAEWLTEESVAEPQPGIPEAAGHASAAAHPPTPPADTAGPPTWLASAEGLVPREAAALRRSAEGREPAPGSDLDLSATRVHPRSEGPAEDWGWQSAPDLREAPNVPVVPARTAATHGWVPFDPKPDAHVRPDEAPHAGAYDPGATGAPAYDQTPSYAQLAPRDDTDGRQAIWGSRPGPGPVPTPAMPRSPATRVPPSYDSRHDPAYDYDLYERKRRGGVPWRRLLVSFVLGLVLAGVVAGGAIYAYEQQYADRILSNVHVGSVDVSGLTRDTARAQLEDAYRDVGQGVVEVTLAGATTEIRYSDFDRHIDVEAVLDEAFAVGRGASPIDRLLVELKAATKGVAFQPRVMLDADKLQQKVQEIARAAESKAVDASAVVTADGFATTPSKTGQRVEAGGGAADVANQLLALDAPKMMQIALAATPIPPAVTDASALLAAKQAALMQNDIILQDGAESWTIPAATVHTWLSFMVINNRARIAIDTKAVLDELTPLAKKIDRTAANATVKLVGTKILFGKPSVDGRTFNASRTTAAVVNALRNRALGNLGADAPIPPVLALVKPTLTTDQAKAAIPLMKEISSWTTNYQPSERNGNGANIRIPTATINGYVVSPGDTFSFWKAVGPVTRELGYTQGGAIIDGHTEPQGAIGGGICSASTTLFNAVVRAGYQMGDRLNHFYYINRYPLGLDATVFISASGQAQDMTWTNDTQYPVIVQGINGKAFVKFSIYSVPNGRTTTFTDPIVKNYTKAHTETRVDKSIPRGTSKQIEYATDGQDVTVTRSVTDKAGAVIHKDTYYSHYATITGIILTNP